MIARFVASVLYTWMVLIELVVIVAIYGAPLWLLLWWALA